MLQRNWLSLDRKLVDKTDMEFTVQGLQDLIDLVSVSMWGPGVLITSIYPTPFVLTPDAGDMGISVGNGIGFDTIGDLTAILPGMTGSPIATPAVGGSLPRWDLLVIEYAQVGDTPIPKPSDPLTTVNLNLHDDFILKIIPGIPNASPAYPAYTGTGFILAGLQVPAGATNATEILYDYSVRLYSRFGFAQQPVFVREIPVGAIDGVNLNYTLSQSPITNGSLIVYVDSLKAEVGSYSLSTNIISFSSPLAIGQDIWCAYVANSPNSQNPVQAITEVAVGAVDGTNQKFTLSQKPLYQAAVDVFVDGGWVSPDQWALVSETGQQSYILFNPGAQPANGQPPVEVQYWMNSWPNLLTAPSTSGGGGGAKEVHGNFVSPILIDPTIGIVPTTSMDQTWYVKPNSPGAQLITSSPAIAAGTTLGQLLRLKGVDPINFLKISSASGNGVNQNGMCNLTDNQSIDYEWDGSNWNENTRRQ